MAVDIHRRRVGSGKNDGVMVSDIAAQEWTPLHQLVALSTAPTVEEFYRRLVLLPPAGNNPADAFEPLCLFRQFHESEPCGAVTTAFLLVTDRRWRDATGRLVRSIAESGCVRVSDLDLLAESFLAAGPYLYWRVPSEWFDGGVEIELNPAAHHILSDDDQTTDEVGDDQPTVVQREIRPPLRRWAAARLARADPNRWSAILRRGRELDARCAAAVARGLLDGIDALPRASQRLLLAVCAEWPQRDVRKAVKESARQTPRPAGAQTTSKPTDLTAKASPKVSENQPALF
jgi:hypothetical protein